LVCRSRQTTGFVPELCCSAWGLTGQVADLQHLNSPPATLNVSLPVSRSEGPAEPSLFDSTGIKAKAEAGEWKPVSMVAPNGASGRKNHWDQMRKNSGKCRTVRGHQSATVGRRSMRAPNSCDNQIPPDQDIGSVRREMAVLHA